MSNAAPVQVIGGDGGAATVTNGGLNVNLSGGDIQIGAVEIKNGSTDTRATVLAASTPVQATDTALVVAVSPNAPVEVSGIVTANQGDAGASPWLMSPLVSATMTATQVTVPATANGIQILASNASRKGATISNPGSVSVYIQQGSTGVTTSNGFAIPAGASYNIDSPLYTGAIYGIVASGTQVVTVVELT